MIPRALLVGLALAGPAHAAPVTVESCGRLVTFDHPPEHAVVHDLNMSEMAFALHLQPRMAGVTGISGYYRRTREFAAEQGPLPELAARYPTIETLVAAGADFFFAGWYYGMKPGGDVTPDTLAAIGIPTYVLTESCAQLTRTGPRAGMELLYKDELSLGRIFGREAEAQALVDGWKARIARVRAAVQGRETPRVFVYDSGTAQPFTAGRFAMPTALVDAAGGRNILDDQPMSWGTTSWEDIAARDPQFLVLLDYQEGSGHRALLDVLRANPAMADNDAVRQGRFIALRYEQLTPGPANIGAVEALAKAMHPDAFPSR